MEQEFQFDLFVIGGGSGGLSAAKAAAKLGASVALADFVQESPFGTTWGLGGTCVNVGCIPKKLMHYCALLGESRFDQKESGWSVNPEAIQHDWTQMVSLVQKHIRQLNFGYKSALIKENVKYYNAYASAQDKHTVQLKNKKGEVSTVTAKNILIAVGTRPSIPEQLVSVKKLLLTSDDLFSLKQNPGKTLVIGASYVALECASFLTAFGNDVTVMVRSILLRGFDQQMSEKIGDYMIKKGTKFLRGYVPQKVEQVNGKLSVTYSLSDDSSKSETQVFDNILVATGREIIDELNLKSVGVKLEKNKKIAVNTADQSTVNNIYAIGDCAFGRPELTPPAIQAGKLLAQRLFNDSTELMDYTNIATTVFTALEYGACGLSEEDAITKFGEDNISVYHTTFKPLEWNYYEEHSDDTCYGKIIVLKENDKVVGLHYFGPNAGEVTQGYAVAIKCGATKKDFDNTVGIHPTCSEEFTTLEVTKAEDENAKKSGC